MVYYGCISRVRKLLGILHGRGASRIHDSASRTVARSPSAFYTFEPVHRIVLRGRSPGMHVKHKPQCDSSRFPPSSGLILRNTRISATSAALSSKQVLKSSAMSADFSRGRTLTLYTGPKRSPPRHGSNFQVRAPHPRLMNNTMISLQKHITDTDSGACATSSLAVHSSHAASFSWASGLCSQSKDSLERMCT